MAPLKDLAVALDEQPYPSVTAAIVSMNGETRTLPWSEVAGVEGHDLRLRAEEVETEPFVRKPGEALLAKDVLDRQVIDVDGRRVVRADELRLALDGDRPRLVGVESGARSVLRRILGTGRPGDNQSVVDWGHVEPIVAHMPGAKVEARHDRLARLHPVEIARIVDSLSYKAGAEVLHSLDDAIAADALREMVDERQADLVEGMPRERAAEILDEMEPDDAADLLADLDPTTARDLLDKMRPEEAQDVKRLLSYDQDTAGGVMTTEFVPLPAGINSGEAIQRLRELIEKPPLIYYLCVVESDESRRLIGVISLRELLLAQPEDPIERYMDRAFQSVRVDEPARQAARTMAEFNLLALPVLTEQGTMVGLVTVDDAMELLLPERMKRKLPRLFA
ncbi:MAG: magnesium transporter MgtE N-terminal domain-containing protein [Chloroflexota bacterium]